MSVPRSDFVAQRAGDLMYYTVPRFAREAGVIAAFSSRRGGKSSGPYATLNLGLHVGDEPEAVLTNRTLLCGALGVDAVHLVSCAQVHGTRVAVVGTADRGRGAFDQSRALPATDGLATGTPGVPLVTFYGDCVPLFLFDPVNRAIALAHAGWRGTLGRIGARAVAVLGEKFGTTPAAVLAAVGPAIGPCCYTVGPDVAALFVGEFSSGNRAVLNPEGGRLDLWSVNRQVLLEAGVRAENIAMARRCTACNPKEFFSHRTSGGKAGRMAAIMALE
ncbi:MAG: peptidoglycan editing factor PgeF [Candidatus Desulforudis sp.]|nr:peptidoglycan editing factor PgeF [Desulforudis sp.]